MKGTLGLASVLLLAACTSEASRPPAPTVPPHAPPLVRDCGSAVFGGPNMKNAMRIGPLILVGIPQAAKLSARAFEPDHGRYDAIKVLAVVKGDQDVTVTVPSSEAENFLLLYDPNARANKHGYPFSARDPRVTFEACPGTSAGYNGGFIARRPTCAALKVRTGTSSDEASLTVGAGSCP